VRSATGDGGFARRGRDDRAFSASSDVHLRSLDKLRPSSDKLAGVEALSGAIAHLCASQLGYYTLIRQQMMFAAEFALIWMLKTAPSCLGLGSQPRDAKNT